MGAPVRKRDAPALARALRDTFGLTALRPGQREVIERVLAGRDTLAIMRSGAGKSLCYQLPAILLEGTTVVVSPLIALMRDQAEKLEDRGVEAEAVNSTLTAREESAALEEIRTGRAEIVFTTPERLGNPEFLATLGRNPIDILVIDEAHCISQWGDDFRPAYLELGKAARALGNPTILALTATAPPEIIEDIKRALDRPGMQVVNAGLYRANLRFAVRQVTGEAEKRRALLESVRAMRGPGIIYTATVKEAEALEAFLREAGESVLLYHGRLRGRERGERQDAFMHGRVRLMVATNAFGLGVDKRDIRFVIHAQVPGGLEQYYQESGRAGRDGEPAWCTLLYDHADRRIQQYFLAGRLPDAHELRAVYENAGENLPKARVRRIKALLEEAGVLGKPGVRAEKFEEIARHYREKRQADREKLERITFYAHGAHCRWKMILEYFGEDGGFERCGVCDNCVRPVKAPPAERMKPQPVPASQWRHGEAVIVPKFGKGLVEAATADRVIVSFPNGETRQFLRSYVARAGER